MFRVIKLGLKVLQQNYCQTTKYNNGINICLARVIGRFVECVT